MNRRRLPHIGWWLLAIVPVVLLAVISPFALDHLRVQQINAVRQLPESEVSPLECEARGPAWLRKLAARCGCEDYLRTRVKRVELLGENFRDEHLGQIPNTEEIESLFLVDVRVTGDGLASLGRMPCLNFVYLEKVELGDGISSLLRNSPNIESLFCKGCSLTPDALLGLPAFPALQRFWLTDAPFRSQDRLFLTGSPDLVWLGLSGTGVDDDIAGLPSSLRNLTRVDLSRTRVGDTIAFELSRKSALTDIDLSETLVTDRGAQALSELDQLDSLYLSEIPLTDRGTTNFDRFESLRILDISKTKISDETLERVLSLPNLIRLDLSGTNITDSGLETLLAELPVDDSFPARVIGIAETAITDAAVARCHWIRPSWKFVRKRLVDYNEFAGN